MLYDMTWVQNSALEITMNKLLDLDLLDRLMAICWPCKLRFIHIWKIERVHYCGEVLFLPMSIGLVWCSEGPSQASSSMGVSEARVSSFQTSLKWKPQSLFLVPYHIHSILNSNFLILGL